MDNNQQRVLLDYKLVSFLPSWDYNETVFHYTSPDGLLGILENGNTFWFTHSSFLNDIEEGKDIIRIYHEQLESLEEKGEIDSEFKNHVSAIDSIDYWFTYEIKKETLEYKEHEVDNYICCFSKNADSLPMWNYYSINRRYEGYNIELDFSGHDDERILFYPVIYNDSKKNKLLAKLIVDVYQKCPNDDEYYDLAKFVLKVKLAEASMAFKNECFQHEGEIRAVVKIPRELCEKDDRCIKYRTKQGYIIPYIERQFSKEIVKGINCAPLIDYKTNDEAIRQLLNRNGYSKDIPINKSKIPIRY